MQSRMDPESNVGPLDLLRLHKPVEKENNVRRRQENCRQKDPHFYTYIYKLCPSKSAMKDKILCYFDSSVFSQSMCIRFILYRSIE